MANRSSLPRRTASAKPRRANRQLRHSPGKEDLFFLDARPTAALIHSGDFDLAAKRIVFGALDIVLALLPDDAAVQKLRGSSFNEDEAPFVTGGRGFDVAIASTWGRVDADVTLERAASGVKRLDTMLGGGYYRGASVPITGFPGTARTTLSGAFAEAHGVAERLIDWTRAGGEVLMGTLRWEKESAERVANEVAAVAGQLEKVSLDAEEAVLEVRAKSCRDPGQDQNARASRGRCRGAGAEMSRRKRIRLCLFIADNTENSEKARANLAALCDSHLIDHGEVEVVDVLREPERALDAGILMTPTLLKLWPLPVQRIVGTLNNIEPLLRILGVKGAAA